MVPPYPPGPPKPEFARTEPGLLPEEGGLGSHRGVAGGSGAAFNNINTDANLNHNANTNTNANATSSAGTDTNANVVVVLILILVLELILVITLFNRFAHPAGPSVPWFLDSLLLQLMH